MEDVDGLLYGECVLLAKELLVFSPTITSKVEKICFLFPLKCHFREAST